MSGLHASAVAAVQAAEAAVKELGREGFRALSALEGVAWELQQAAPMERVVVSEPSAPVAPVKEAEPVVVEETEPPITAEPPVPEFAPLVESSVEPDDHAGRDSSGE